MCSHSHPIISKIMANARIGGYAYRADVMIIELEKAMRGTPSHPEFDEAVRGGISFCEDVLTGIMWTPESTVKDIELASLVSDMRRNNAEGLRSFLEPQQVEAIIKTLQCLRDRTDDSPKPATEEMEIAQKFFLECLRALNRARG